MNKQTMIIGGVIFVIALTFLYPQKDTDSTKNNEQIIEMAAAKRCAANRGCSRQAASCIAQLVWSLVGHKALPAPALALAVVRVLVALPEPWGITRGPVHTAL